MTRLYCAKCKTPHNLDQDPDTGECTHCSGLLVQSDEEEELLDKGFGHAVTKAVAEGLTAARFASSVKRGDN